jgi:hypothetical protein
MRTGSLKRALADGWKNRRGPGRIWTALNLQIAVGSMGESTLLFLVNFFAVIGDGKKLKRGFFRLTIIMSFFEGLTNLIKKVY